MRHRARGHRAAVFACGRFAPRFPQMKQLALDLARVPAPTLDNFVAGRNAELVDQLRRLAADADAERFFYVWGPAGSGRSHLLEATVTAALAAGRGAAYCRSAHEVDAADCARDSVLLAVDDVDALDDRGQIDLFNIYNELRAGTGRLLAAGAAPPRSLALRADLVTRLTWGLVYQLHPLSDDDTLQALQHHASLRGFTLSDEAVHYLLHRFQRDMPSLLALIEALDRHSLEAKRPVTLALVRELVQRVLEARPAQRGGHDSQLTIHDSPDSK